jgi:hypothetical protein
MQCTSDSECAGDYFLVWSKTYNGAFLGTFLGGLNLFDPKIAIHYTQQNIGVKNVSAPLKNPSKCPIMCFSYEKKSLPHFQNQR